MKVFLNPGHSPEWEVNQNLEDAEPGACGNGLMENIVAKSVTDLIAEKCKEFGIEIVGNLQSSSLYEITDTANATDADAFVSIHCNSASPAANGTETFYCQGSMEGAKFAGLVQENIVAALHTTDRGIKDDTLTQHKRIHVLRATNMPAILVELAFISNAEDAEFLRDYQEDFAEAIAKGIATYGGIDYSRITAAERAAKEAAWREDLENLRQELSYEEQIWGYLKGRGLNDFAAAGVMGNLYAESGLSPTNLENYYESSLGMNDKEYTAAVDDGSYDNFVHDSAGYGLAQWTYWSRKQALLKHIKGKGVSIGDLSAQLEYLWHEMQLYPAMMKHLHNADSVEKATSAFMLEFERPADQSEAAQWSRANFSHDFYRKYAGQTIPQKEQEETEMRYNKISEMPDWAQPTIRKLTLKGILNGGGVKDENGDPADLDLSKDMIRIYVSNDRAGLYDRD